MPKDLYNKRQGGFKGSLKEWEKKKHPHRFAKDWEHEANDLFEGGDPNKPIRTYNEGNVTKFRMSDMPQVDDKPDIMEMTDEEYDKYIKKEREWSNWKDEHEKGAGNPYFRS